MIEGTAFPLDDPLSSADSPLILVVDDEKMMRMLLRRAMEKDGYRVEDVANGEQAILAYQAHKPAIVLLDAMMPLMDGFTCCAKLRSLSQQKTPASPAGDTTQQISLPQNRTPILMITSLDDPVSVDRAFEVGAADYVTKPIHWPVLRQRVRRLLQQVALIEQLEAVNQELHRLASLDGLTGLANRRRFDLVLEQEWRRGVREAWEMVDAPQLSLILCDVDCFKLYNDTYGHQAGDACLQAVAGVLKQAARRPADLAARYGGEEFALILPHTNTQGATHVAEMARQMLKACAIAHAASPVSKFVTLSLGVISVVPTPEMSPTQLIEAADMALYQAKATGRDRAIVNSSLIF